MPFLKICKIYGALALSRAILLLFLFGIISKGFGLSPMVEYNDLVAGAGEKGYRDGSFTSALFNHPTGLAIDPDGTRLFVADTLNNLIRVVLLDQNNQVRTIAGNGSATCLDGDLSKAAFKTPLFISYIGQNKLLVYDAGDWHFRLVNLETKTVSTLDIKAPDGKTSLVINPLGGMVYRPKENALYFCQRAPTGALQKLDLQTYVCSPMPFDSPVSLDLGPICDYQAHICIADLKTGEVYQVEPRSNTLSASVSLKEIGKEEGVVSMTSTGGTLYGIPAKVNSTWTQIAPAKGAGPLSLIEVWGDTVNDENGETPDLSYFFMYEQSWQMAGFVADPRDDKRFFLSLPFKNVILSLRDYRFDQYKANIPGGTFLANENGITDFDYPTRKPPKTFRILISGTSYTYQLVEMHNGIPDFENRMEILPKKLELILNTLSALLDGPVHFQVLHLGHPDLGDGLTWSYYHVSDIVKKFDIDLCIRVVDPDWDEYQVYFNYPLTHEGIPAEMIDPEYLLKPLKERASANPVLKDFYDRCVKAQLGNPSDGRAWSGIDKLMADKAILSDLIELEGKPHELLSQKVQSIKTSSGAPVDFELCFLPLGNIGSETDMPNDSYRNFWKDVCEMKNIHFMDLTDASNALKTTYFDTSQTHYGYHFNHKGQLLNAILLAHELIRLKLIPLEYPADKK